MTDQTDRDLVADHLRDLAVKMVDVAACIRDGADVAPAISALQGCGSCLHLAEMTLLHISQIELRSQP